jgi:phage terminase large subunit GpA-like protein
MTITELVQSARRQWAPPPRQTVSEWAEANFRLSAEYSAVTGPLKLYKFQRGPLDAFGDPFVRELVVMSATQMLKTLTDQVIVAHSIACDPGPILFAQPTETDAETFSKERLGPMIRDMECLRSRVSVEKQTSSANTITHKVFKGGSLSLIGAQTAGNFARRSIRVFIADERDKWKKNVGKEGDGYSLGVKRTATFRSRAKLVQTCSPTIEGDSAIAEAYERSDQRKFHVPCHACGHLQILAWGQVKWTSGEPLTAKYHCSECDAAWGDVQRWTAGEAPAADWFASKPFEGVAGFWISELYSPWKKLSEIVADFLAKKDSAETLQTFVNTTLAETWRQPGDAPEWEKVAARAQDYTLGTVPDGVRFLTAGVDVQVDRLEMAVWGWGRGRKRWLVDYQIIDGSPAKSETWDALTEAMQISYPTAAGVDLPICRVAVDSGYEATKVYEWARKQGAGRVLVAKGYDSGVALLGLPSGSDMTQRGKRAKYGVKVWPVNVSMAKQELYGQIRLEREEGAETPAGWVSIPSDGWIRPTHEEFCRQLVAEQYVVKIVKGYRKGEWVKCRERNEALDTANLARAGAEHVGVSRMGDRDWAKLDAQFGVAVQVVAPAQVVQPPPQVEQPKAPPPQLFGAQRGQYFGERRGWFSR